MDEELKECPFCGGKASAFSLAELYPVKSLKDRPPMYRVSCTDCYAASSDFPSRPAAIAAWNRRTGT